MKITKSQLKRIIKEETEAVLNEGQMADKKWQDNPANPEYGRAGAEDPDDDSDDAAELESGLDLTGFELTKDRGYYFIVDKESGERVLGPFRTEGQAEERAMRSDTRSEFETSQDVLSKLGR
mgnify:CR=1 FL=1